MNNNINICNIIEQILEDLNYREFTVMVPNYYSRQIEISLTFTDKSAQHSYPQRSQTVCFSLTPVNKDPLSDDELLKETKWVILNLGVFPAIDFLKEESIETFKQIVLMSSNLRELNDLTWQFREMIKNLSSSSVFGGGAPVFLDQFNNAPDNTVW